MLLLAEKLLTTFQSGWYIKLHRLPPSPDMAGSPLQPVLAVVRRCLEQQDGRPESFASVPVELDFAEDPSCCNAEQLHDIIQVLAWYSKPSLLLYSPSWHCHLRGNFHLLMNFV